MKYLVVSVFLVILHTATSQDDGGFWWLNPPKKQPEPTTTPKPETPPPPIDERHHQSSNQRPCECVPYYQCNEGEIVTDGTGIIDIRVGPNPSDTKRVGGNCENILDVCCHGPSKPTPPPPAPPPQFKDVRCGITLNAEGPVYDIDIRIHLNKSIHGFDGVAPFAQYPWMAALLLPGKTPSEPTYKCGGSLIHPKVVLTAAHCVEEIHPSQLTVRLGEWDTQSDRDHQVYLHQDYDVADIILHDNYIIGTRKLYDDIALVFLRNEAQLDHHINTVCLPQPGEKFDHQRCYATGWGRDNFGIRGQWQAILKEVDLPIIEQHSCQNQFKANRRLGCRFCLHDTFLCAGGEAGKDTCQGDGGSPLVCFNNGVGIQSGIVAWGIGCGEPIPAAYVDVARYVHWIDHTVSRYYSKQGSSFNYQWRNPYSYEGSPNHDLCKGNLFNGAYNKLSSGHPCARWQS